MGLFDFFKKQKPSGAKFVKADTLDWREPIFSQYGDKIYTSDVVQQAISCVAREMRKLNPLHIMTDARGKVAPIADEIQAVLDNPNPQMTTGDFIEKVVWQVFLEYNAFILPEWQNGRLVALYPLSPNRVEFVQDASGAMFCKMTFRSGHEGIIPYSDLAHIRLNYAVNEWMGGNEDGQPDNKPLIDTLGLNKSLLDGVKKSLNSSFAINGVIKYNTLLDREKTEAEIKKLTDALKKSESGLMGLDLKGDYIPINRTLAAVDETTLKFIDSKILRHFGVPLPILSGDYTKAQYEAFYQKTIEPLTLSISQALTKALFSRRESVGFGHKITFGRRLLEFMTMEEKIKFATLMTAIGGMTINEARAMFGYAPSDEEYANKLIMSKNFGTVDAVAEKDKAEQN